MPALPDYLRILADAGASTHHDRDPDIRIARGRRASLPRPRLRVPRWLREPHPGMGDEASMPVLRDYPWRSDGA